MYVWNDDSLDHARSSASLQFALRSGQQPRRPIFSLTSYARWAGDLKDNDRPGSPRVNIYYTYLQVENLPKDALVQAGRVFTYSTAGSNVMDGVRLQYGRASSILLSVYAGSWVSNSDSKRIRSLADFGVSGAGLAYLGVRSVRVGIDWMRRLNDEQCDLHRAGLFVEANRWRMNLYSRVVYNLNEMRLAELLARVTYGARPWSGSAELNSREPSVSSTSLFSLIDFRRYRQGRFQLRRYLWKNVAANGNLNVTVFDGRDSWTAVLAISTDFGVLGWQHQDGYPGDNNGVFGNLTIRPYQRLECYAAFNLCQYRVQSLQTNRNDSYSSSIGARIRLGVFTELSSEVQYLRNAVQSEDVRLLAKFTQRFDTGSSRGATGK